MKTEDMDLGTGGKPDRQEAVAGAAADESAIAAGFEGAAEDACFSGDAVFAEESEFEISGKMDLTAVQVSGEHVVEGTFRSFITGIIGQGIDEVRVVDQKEAESVVGCEIVGDRSPGTFATLVVCDAADGHLETGEGDFFPCVEKKNGAHLLVIFRGQTPVVVAVDGQEFDSPRLKISRDLSKHPEVGSADGLFVYTIPTEKHDVAVVVEKLSGDPGGGTEATETVCVGEEADGDARTIRNTSG